MIKALSAVAVTFVLGASAYASDYSYPTVSHVGYGGGGYGTDPMFPYDGQQPWLHGYFQEIPAYGGYRAYRPYNYKHVLSQSQAAGGWGMNSTMPYSQQFWHRYHDTATMREDYPPTGVSGPVYRGTIQSEGEPVQQRVPSPEEYYGPSSYNQSAPQVVPQAASAPYGGNGPVLFPGR